MEKAVFRVGIRTYEFKSVDPRWATAVQLKQEGKTLKQIGAALGLSRERARQLVFLGSNYAASLK